MDIDKNTLPKMLESFVGFKPIFENFCEEILWSGRLLPVLSSPRLEEAWEAWKEDLTRLEKREPNLRDDGLDHFKHAAHLSFWIRKMTPIVEAIDVLQNIGDAEGAPLSESEKAFRSLMLTYCNEYVAFDIGYQIVMLYEMGKPGQRAEKVKISRDYLQTVCHFLKYKTVSPHAIQLILRSTFLPNGEVL